MSDDLERILNCIDAPQFMNLDTVQLSHALCCFDVVATDSLGHTFQLSQFAEYCIKFYPLQQFGAVITTLRLGPTLWRFKDSVSSEFLRSLDAVQALEFDGTMVDYVQEVLSVTGVFPGLKVMRVAVSRVDCEGAFKHLAVVSFLRVYLQGQKINCAQSRYSGWG